jgi:membrane glycosyltransferase
VDALMARSAATVPPLAELAMPAQSLRRHERERSGGWPSPKTLLARLVTFGGAVALTAYATREMVAVVSVGEISALQWAMVVLFVITFGWISIAATAAVSGVFFGGVRLRSREGQGIEHRTAIVMPVYNENPASSFAGLQAMAECLLQQGATGFELFVLSDTNNPDIWVRETAALHSLREAVGDGMHVWYRRRSENSGRKVGNLHDFITKWSGRWTRTRTSASCRRCRGSRAGRRCSRGCSSLRVESMGRSWHAASRHGRATTATTGATTPSCACARSHLPRGSRP